MIAIKKSITLTFPFALMLTGCVEDVPAEDNDNVNTEISTRAFGQEGDLFYYYFDEKIYLTQRADQIFLKFAPDATEEQFRMIAQSKTPSQKANWNGETRFTNGGDFNTLVLEAPQSREVLNSLKAKKEIASAEYLLEYNGQLSAVVDEFSVKLKKDTSQSQLQELAKKNNCIVSEPEYFGEDEYLITVPKMSDLNTIGMANLFYETGLFEFTAPNFVSFNVFDSNDSHYGDQWNLNSTGQYGSSVDIDVERAWTITQGRSDIKIAVMDTGVDLTHPDLQANLLSGFDATVSSGTGSAGGVVYNPNRYEPWLNAHGTAVAGIIGAIKDNGIGVAGIAPGCRIIPIRVGNESGMLDTWALRAFDWARTRADVISCSWHLPNPNSQLTNAIGRALSEGRGNKGCVVVFNSGNDNLSTLYYPANSHHYIIAVGAVGLNGQRKSPSSPDGEQWGSNYGNGLDVVAPGVLIPTTDIQGSIGFNSELAIHTEVSGDILSNDYTTDQNYTVWFNGTSAAAPHVAGIAALMLSVNPNLTRKQVADVITQTAQKVGGYNYTPAEANGLRNDQMGYGLVNAYEAVSAVAPGQPLSGGVLYSSLQTSQSHAEAQVMRSAISPRGGNWTYSFQWQIRMYKPYWGMMDWIDIPYMIGESLTLDFFAMSKETHFRRKVTSGSSVAYSNTLTFSPQYNIDGGTISGVDIVQYGGQANLSSATYGPPSSSRIFYWEQSSNGITWNPASGSATTYGFTTDRIYSRTFYRLRVMNPDGKYGYSYVHTVEVS